MKKTLIALAVLATAGSVNAAQIYGSDTSKVSLSGEIDSYLASWDRETQTTASTITKSENDPHVNLWAKIQIDAEHQLNDTFKAFGSFEIETTEQGWNTTTADYAAGFDDLYAGVKTDTWGVVMGEHGDWADSMDATEKDDITNEGYYLGNAGGHHNESSGHGIGFKYYGVDNLTLVADVTTESTKDVDNIYGVSADYALGNFGVGASFQSGELATGNSTYPAADYHKGGVSVSATFGGFYAAATYVSYEGEQAFGFWKNTTSTNTLDSTVNKGDRYYEGNSYGVAASYTVDSFRVYSTYAVMSNDKYWSTSANTTTDLNDADVSNLVVGAEYTVTDNLMTFVEYQKATAESGLVAGTSDLDASSVVFGTYYSF